MTKRCPFLKQQRQLESWPFYSKDANVGEVEEAVEERKVEVAKVTEGDQPFTVLKREKPVFNKISLVPKDRLLEIVARVEGAFEKWGLGGMQKVVLSHEAVTEELKDEGYWRAGWLLGQEEHEAHHAGGIRWKDRC